MDHNASEERDLESGGTGHEDETSKRTISGNKQAKNMVGRLMSGLLGYSGSANGESSASTDSKLGTSSEDPHDNIELLTDKNSGQSVELMPLLEKKPVKNKRKTSFRKASKPPRPPKGPTLDVSDVKLVMEISELAMKKRARIQRIKALKKMNAEMSSSSPLSSSPSSPSSSSTSNSSLAAMVVTLLFFVIIVFQGIYSRNSSSASFQGSPEPATAVNGLISIQLYNSTPEIYMVSEVEKLNWNILPRDKYPKPLIFHDGRLAFRPTPLATLAMFMWFPLGSILAILRIIIALSLPYNISIPILTSTGIKLRLSKPNHLQSKVQNSTNGVLYVCNHRTLLDPLFISFGLKKPLAAVTYSLSRMSEILSPIRTVRLTRSRDGDRKMMDKLLNQGDLVVCPEGTTCREPYLLRLSPLFTELSDNILPVGMDTHVGMFHGTTAGGLKCLDPIFFLMNPSPSYTVRFLDRVSGSSACKDGTGSRFEVANYVQSELGKVLGFECTMLTRKDKYLILAGNEGIVSANKGQ